MAKCLIAGLPNAGKSTYIAALSYLLQSPIEGQKLHFREVPEDMSSINRLINPWLEQKEVERTARGKITNFTFDLERTHDGSYINVSMPDIAGEDFTSILQSQNELLISWDTKPDSLLYFINDIPVEVLKDSFKEENSDLIDNRIPLFSSKYITAAVKNVLLIKELRRLFPWSKIAIGISSWDVHSQEEETPDKYLKTRSPFLWNFLKYHFPEAFIFGISAQGWDYKDERKKEDFINKTVKGTRSYIVNENGEKSFDLTEPLSSLIS